MSTRGTAELPRLYGDLAGWYDLVIPLASIRDECLLYGDLLVKACTGPARTILDLGSGAGHTVHYLKAALVATLVDLSPEMVEAGRKLNPECEHHVADMRTVRLGRQFDLVLINDSVGFMADLHDLRQAVHTAFVHCRAGGAALFCPDHVRETFIPGTHWGGHEDGERTLRYLAWVHQLPGDDGHYINDLAYMMQGGRGDLEGAHERHLMGLFSRADWLAVIEEAGFRARCVTIGVGSQLDVIRDAFVASKPVAHLGAPPEGS